MSANTLTGLVPTIYEALDVVSRELVGFIPAVSRDSQASRAAKDQTVRSPITPALTAEDVTPSNTSPNTAGFTSSSVDIVITKSRAVPFNFNGEEMLGTARVQEMKRDLIAQAVRTLANEIENDLAGVYIAASRAYGTAGTTPFATAADMSDLAQSLKILQDNGCPMNELKMILGTTASANIRGKQSQLFKVNEAGSSDLLRRGSLGDLMGFQIGESAKVKAHTKGTGTGYLVNGALAIGATTITVDTGAGTIVAGDVVTFAGDTNKYVVTSALSGGSFTIGLPGLVAAVADNVAITVGNSYTANAAFHKGAIQLAVRAPALPEGGDSADERIMIVDPVSGLNMEFSVYRQYRQVRWEVAAAWGVKMIKPAHAALLLG